MRAVNDILIHDEADGVFVHRLGNAIYDGVLNLGRYMSKTMRKRLFDIANAITTAVIYRLYDIHGGENQQAAIQYLRQYKCLRVLCNNLWRYLNIYDLPNEISDKVETIGKPLFNFINKKY